MPCTDVIGYSFGGLCCLQLHFTLKMEAAWSSKIMVSYIITQRALTWIFNTMRNLKSRKTVHVSENRQHELSSWWCYSKLLGLWWWRMILCSATSFGFWTEAMHSCLIVRHDSPRKIITLCFKAGRPARSCICFILYINWHGAQCRHTLSNPTSLQTEPRLNCNAMEWLLKVTGWFPQIRYSVSTLLPWDMTWCAWLWYIIQFLYTVSKLLHPLTDAIFTTCVLHSAANICLFVTFSCQKMNNIKYQAPLYLTTWFQINCHFETETSPTFVPGIAHAYRMQKINWKQNETNGSMKTCYSRTIVFVSMLLCTIRYCNSNNIMKFHYSILTWLSCDLLMLLPKFGSHYL